MLPNYAIKRDLRENTIFKSIIGRVGPLFWLLGNRSWSLRVFNYILWTLSLLLFLCGAFVYATTPGSIARNKEFKASGFMPTIQFVTAYKQKFGTLPTDIQFEEWKLTHGWENRALFLETSGNLKSEDCPFGVIPAGTYGVTVWRGDWYECYASWLNEYSFDGTKAINIKAMLVLFLFSAALLFIQQAVSRLTRYLTTQSSGTSV